MCEKYFTLSNQETTYYIGNSFERIDRATSTEYRHVIRANGRAIMLRKSVGAGVSHQYIHRDHLGSVTALTDENTGAVLQRLSYDAWGKRRSATDWTSAAASTSEYRGYTGHEHLDEVGLIHMNGRIYSPTVARMLSPDPVTQAPENGQNYNRYTYAFNNPLKYTDPSGYYADGASFIVNSIVSSVFYKIGGLFGGGGCDADCQLEREIRAWCNTTNCLAPRDPIERLRAGEDLAYVGNSGNQMTMVQAWMIDQSRAARGDNTSGGDPIAAPDVVGNERMDAAAVEALERLPYRQYEFGGTIDIDSNGNYVIGEPARGREAETSIQPNANTVAVYHSHPRYRGYGSRRTNRENMLPGDGDHIAVSRNYPNYFRDPFGNIRVVERISGEFRVRTVKGTDVMGQDQWRP